MSKNKLIFLLTLAAFIAYGTSLRYGFSQDDWFHLSISHATNFSQFINFFNPTSVTWIFFRPLSTQLPYWLAMCFFPLSTAPYFMHAVMLIIHIINAYLVVHIARKYLRDQFAVFLGIVYALSTLHFLSLFYIGAIQQLISTLFSLLAIALFTRQRTPSQWILGLLTLGALLSKELALRLPLILLVLSYLKDRKFYPTLTRVVGPIIVTLLYLSMRYLLGTQLASEYDLVFSLGTALATLMWYGLFLLGFPERLLSYGLSLGKINFSGFIVESGPTAWLVVLSASIILYLCFKRFYASFKSHSLWSDLVFPGLAVLSLTPVLFLPTHRYPHYLDLAILFVGIWLLQELSKFNWPARLTFGFVCLGMLAGIGIEARTHWTIQRSIVSRQISQEILQSGQCSDPAGIVFRGTSVELRELSYALSNENGPRVICQNPALQVYYKNQP